MAKTIKEIKCSYFKCPCYVITPDPEVSGMQFCETHDDELSNLIRSSNAKGILSFWVKAQGGAERAAKRMMGTLNGDEEDN